MKGFFELFLVVLLPLFAIFRALLWAMDASNSIMFILTREGEARLEPAQKLRWVWADACYPYDNSRFRQDSPKIDTSALKQVSVRNNKE